MTLELPFPFDIRAGRINFEAAGQDLASVTWVDVEHPQPEFKRNPILLTQRPFSFVQCTNLAVAEVAMSAPIPKLESSIPEEASRSTNNASEVREEKAYATEERNGMAAEEHVTNRTESRDAGDGKGNEESERSDQIDNGKEQESDDETVDMPPLPEEPVPPLPQEAPPVEDDGWAPVWDEAARAFYFYNRFTSATQWTNPRVPEATHAPDLAPGVSPAAAQGTVQEEVPSTARPAGGYDPAIHGDYDPTAWYAQPAPEVTETPINPTDQYAAVGAFNRFTGRWQAADVGPELHNDENKSKRQLNAFFDVDAAANSHDGRSLKAERSGKKLTKSELKQFKEKRKARKEEKRRAWLRD